MKNTGRKERIENMFRRIKAVIFEGSSYRTMGTSGEYDIPVCSLLSGSEWMFRKQQRVLYQHEFENEETKNWCLDMICSQAPIYLQLWKQTIFVFSANFCLYSLYKTADPLLSNLS